MRILGFDVSSSCIGYGVLDIEDNKIKFVSCNYLKPIKKGTILERIVDTREKIIHIINEVKPDHIALEDLIKFMPKSTASTVIVLTTFNRMICLCCYDYNKEYPKLCNVASIRSKLKIKDRLKKEDVPAALEKHLNIKLNIKYKKTGKIDPITYDISDGLAVATYYAFILTGRIK